MVTYHCDNCDNGDNGHEFDSLTEEGGKKDPTKTNYQRQSEKIFQLLLAAANGDVSALERAHLNGLDMDLGDYDGRTALHLAAAEGHKRFNANSQIKNYSIIIFHCVVHTQVRAVPAGEVPGEPGVSGQVGTDTPGGSQEVQQDEHNRDVDKTHRKKHQISP